MKYKQVSRIKEKISAIGLGCWAFSGEDVWDNSEDNKSISIIHAALDAGVNFFDVAPVYGMGHAETVLGKAIKGKDRSNFLIASKCGLVWDDSGNISNCLTKESILKEIDNSLLRLGTDYIDIYQLHWPDKNTPIEQTLEAIQLIMDSGKIKYFGLSNFNIIDADKIDKIIPVSSEQGLYNMFERNAKTYHNIKLDYQTEREVLPFCITKGQAFLPYSPMMQGLLSGRFNSNDNFSEKDIRSNNPKLKGENFSIYFNAVVELKKIGEQYGHPLNEIAINWLVKNPAVTSVIGSALSTKQINDNINSLNWTMTEEMSNKIDEVIKNFENL